MGTEPDSWPRVAVVGAGIAGICAAIRLKQAGVRDLVVLEKTQSIGGTWRDNIYPGAACDVPSHLYSFSFAPNAEWSRVYAPQAEILDYLEDCVETFGIGNLIRYGAEVAEARYDAEPRHWRIELRPGEPVFADILIIACGQLHRPNIPDFAGMESFAGQCMHSARWQPGCDVTGKNVAVIGSAASAVQIAPEIVDDVRHLTVFQRTPNWIAPRLDRKYSAFEKQMMHRFRFLQTTYRLLNFLFQELFFLAFRPNSLFGRSVAFITRMFMRRKIKREDLIEPLMPDYSFGCKRVLLSSTFLKMFRREDVSLVAREISNFETRGVVTQDGKLHEADIVVLATGFQVSDMLAPIVIRGRKESLLSDAWKRGAYAYLGITVPGFPNMFLLYGPNTGLGHNSMIFMIERQVEYICKLLQRMRRDRISEIEVRKDVSETFNDKLQSRMSKTSWSGNCASWYKNEHGLVVAVWPYSTIRYWWMTRNPELRDYLTSCVTADRSTS